MKKLLLFILVIMTTGILYSQIIAKFDERFINPQELLFSEVSDIEENSFLLTQIYGSPVLTKNSTETFNIHQRLYSPENKYNILESLSLFVYNHNKIKIINDDLSVFSGNISNDLIDYSNRPINLEYIKDSYLVEYPGDNIYEYFKNDNSLNSMELLLPILIHNRSKNEEFEDLYNYDPNKYNFTYLLFENKDSKIENGLVFSFPFLINEEQEKKDSYVIYNLTVIQNSETEEKIIVRNEYRWEKKINELNIQSAYEKANAGFIEFHRYPDATDTYLPDFEDSLKMNPESPEGFAALGNYYLYLGETQHASELIKKAIEYDPDLESPIVLKAYGALLFSQNDYERAKSAFQKSLEIDSSFPYSLRNLAFINVKDGEIRTAVKNLEKAVELDPDWIYPLDDLASLYYLQRNYDLAKKTYSYVILKRPELIKPYIYSAIIYRKEGKFQVSEIFLKKALSIDVNDWLANFHMGYLFEIQDDLDKSSFYYSRYDKLKIQNKDSFYNDFWYSNPFINLSIQLNIGLYDILDFKTEDLKIYLDGPIYIERFYEKIQAGTLFQFELVDIPSGQYIFKATWGKKKMEKILDISEDSHLMYTIY